MGLFSKIAQQGIDQDRAKKFSEQTTTKAASASAETSSGNASQTGLNNIVSALNAQQKLLYQPETRKKWYSGDTPTSSEVLARIYSIGKTDSALGNNLYNTFTGYLSDPSNPYYNPYLQATSRDIAAIAELGIDVSGGINDEFFKNNAWLMNYYRLGTGNSPLGPANKATKEQTAAYYYERLLDQYETTQQAQKEWDALKETIGYWANRTDRNYSDDEILNMIDWSKYKTLQKLDDDRSHGLPTQLTSAIGYSKDNLKGVIWAARNGSTGDAMLDAVQAVLGNGKTWKQDDKITAKLDPQSDAYSPYSVGSTIDDAALYFGVSEFGKNWLERNRAYLAGNDATAKKMYQAVYDAEQTTLKAEEELKQLWDAVEKRLKSTSDPARVLAGLQDAFPTLAKMDESLNDADLIDTTRAIDYRWKDVVAEVTRCCEEKKNAAHGSGFVSDVRSVMNRNGQRDSIYHKANSYDAVQETRNNAVNNAAMIILDAGTDEEKIVFETGYDPDYDNNLQQINDAIKNGEVDEASSYSDAMQAANEYAGQNYLGVLDTLKQRDEKQKAIEEAQQKIDSILNKPGQSTEAPGQSSSRTGIIGVLASAGASDQPMAKPSQTVEAKGPQSLEEQYDFDDWLDEEKGILAKGLTRDQEAQYYAEWRAARETPSPEKGELEAKIDSLDEESQRAYYEAKASMEDAQEWLEDNADEIAEAEAEKKKILDDINTAELMRQTYQITAEDTSILPDVELLHSIGSEYKPTVFSSLSALDALMEQYGKTYAEAADDARKFKEEYQQELSAIEKAVEHAGPYMFTVRDFERNLDREKARLKREIEACDYFLLRENEDFAGKAEEARKNITEKFDSFWEQFLPDYEEYSQLDRAVVDLKWSALQNTGAQSLFLTDFMSDDEKDTYLYIRATEGKAAAKAYYDYLADDTYGVLTVRAYEQNAKSIQDFATSHPLLANVTSVLSSPGKIAGGLYGMYQLITGQEVNPYSKYYSANNFNNAVKATTKQNITEALKDSPFLSTIANGAYDVVTSAAESGLNAVMFGGVNLGSDAATNVLSKFALKATESAIGAAAMAAGAMGDTIQQVIRDGGTPEQAFLMGAVAFISEDISEGISFDNMLDAFNGGAEATKGFFKTVLKSAAMEGSEEIFSEMVENWADDKIMGELAKRQQYIAEFRAQGYEREEAEKLAAAELFKDMLKAGLMGSLSGGLSAGVAYGAGAVNRAINKARGIDSVADISDQGREPTPAEVQVEQAPESTNAEPRRDVTQRLEGVENVADISGDAGTQARSAEEITPQAVETAQPSIADESAGEPNRAVTQRLEGVDSVKDISEDAGSQKTTREAVENAEAPAAESGTFTAGLGKVSDPDLGQTVQGAVLQQVKREVAALGVALGADAASQTETAASVLTPDDTNSWAGRYASAAAQHLAAQFNPDTLVMTLRNALLTAVNRADMTVEAVKNSIVTAGLNARGQANRILENMVQNGVTPAGLMELIRKAAQEIGDTAASSQMRDAVVDNMVAQREKQLIADGALEGVHAYEVSADEAHRQVSAARARLQDAQKKLQTMGQKIQSLVAQHNQNPTDQKVGGMLTQAIKDHQGQVKVIDEYSQSLDNAEHAEQTAQDTLRIQRDAALSRARQQALADVGAQMQQEAAEQAAQEAQEAAQAAGQMESVTESNVQEAETQEAPQAETPEQPLPEPKAFKGGGNIQPGKTTNTPVVSGQSTIEEVTDALGITNDPRIKKYIRRLRNTTGGYTMQNGVIHVKDAQDANAAVHEIGHNLDVRMGMKSWVQDMNALAQQYAAQVDPDFLLRYDPSEIPDELMAEFTRVWALDRNNAVNLAGAGFVNRFEQELKKNGWLKPLQEAGEQMRRWDTATSLERAESMVSLDIKKPTEKLTVEKARTNIADHTLPLQKITDALKGKRNWSEATDARTLELALPSAVANLTQANIDEGITDARGEAVTKDDGTKFGALKDITRKIGALREKAFNTYLLARLQLERGPQGKSLLGQDIDAQEVVNQYEKENSDFRDIANELYDWLQAFQQTWWVGYGIDQETFDKFRALYPSYVPLVAAEKSSSGKGDKRTDTVPGIKAKKAYESDVNKYNPIMAITEMVQKHIETAKKIEVLRAFDTQMHDMLAQGLDLEGIAEPAQKDIERRDFASEFENARQEIKDLIDQLYGAQSPHGMPTSVADKLLDALDNVDTTVFVPKNKATGNDVLNIPMEDGTVHSWTIYDPGVFKALTAQRTSGNKYRFARAVGQMLRFMSANATSRSLKFSGQNVFSDVETSSTTGKTGYNNMAKDIFANTRPVHMAKEVWAGLDLLRNMAAETRLGQALGMETSERYEAFKKFGLMGNRYAFRDTKTQRETRRALYGGHATFGEALLDVVKSPVALVEAISDFGEEMTRYNAFGFSGFDLSTYSGKLAAGRASREATVDFSKYGASSDSNAYRIAANVIPFLNAQIQGIDKTLDTLSDIKNDPYRRGVLVGRIAVNSLLMGAVTAALRHLAWGDDEEEGYKDLTDYEKTKFIHLWRWPDGSWFKMKRSQDMLVQMADLLGETAGELLTGYDGDAISDLVNGAREVVKNGVISTDTVFQPIIDATNGQTWYGSDVDTYNERQMSKTARYGMDTSKTARLISTITDGLVSPNAADYVIKQYLGSVGTLGTAVFDTLADSVKGGSVDASSMYDWFMDDVVSGFIVDPVYSNKIATSYYAGKEKLDQILTEAEKGDKAPEYLRYGLTQDEMNAAYAEAKALTSKGGAVYDAGTAYSNLKKEYNAATGPESTLTPYQQEEEGRRLRHEMNMALLEANTAMGDYFNKYGYSNEAEQAIYNSLNVFTNDKHVPVMPVSETQTLKDAVKENDLDTALATINTLAQSGKKTSTIKAQVTREIKPLYKEAYAANDLDKMQEIETMLKMLGLNYKDSDFRNWLK